MRKSTLLMCSICIFTIAFGALAQYGQYSSRSLLKKKIYYVSGGKIGTAEFWALHLGSHDVKLAKEFPGEGTIDVDASINFSLLSSGYIEGKGYSERGKITASAQLAQIVGEDAKDIEMDSIDFVTANGRKVKTLNGEAGTLVLHAENDNRKVIRQMLLREFYYDKAFSELKFDKDFPIQAFSFTKAGAQKALKALSESN
ncbi:MAG: hypothetical protein ACOC4C_05260 [Fibrobacterota bacterium]